MPRQSISNRVIQTSHGGHGDIAESSPPKNNDDDAFLQASDERSPQIFEESVSDNLEEYSKLQDSIYKLGNTGQIAQMQTQFETEKKEKEILLQKSMIGQQETQLKQETTQKYAFIGGFILMIILAAVSFNSFRST